MQEKQSFEEGWRDALQGGEIAPSDKVWSNIELDLAAAEGSEMKKRIVFYQRLAAALVIVSASLGFMVWNNLQDQSPIAEAVPAKTVPSIPPASESTAASSESTPNASQQSNLITASIEKPRFRESRSSDQSRTHSSPSPTSFGTADPANKLVAASDGQSQQGSLEEVDNVLNSDVIMTENDGRDSVQVAAVQPVMTEEEALKVLDEFINPKETVVKNDESRKSLWIGMGAAAGSYNPNAGTNSSLQTASNQYLAAGVNDQVGQTRQHASGNAYSMGVSVGQQISSRWVIQSGINYVNQNINYTSNVLAFTSTNQAKAAIPEYIDFANMETADVEAFTTTDAYTVRSAVEMISIPVQAGFLIIDRKVGWQVNSGVSSDLFLRNTVVDESGKSERFEQGAGKSSPYKTLNWVGLMSTEVSYQLGTHYRLSLVPGVRYYLTSMLKGQSNTPMILDLGFRFKYIVH